MRLTRFTDYTLRTLMYLALHPDGFVTIAAIARAYQISSNHLMKVVQHLAAQGDIVTMRGQHGGLRLARPASAIKLGQVIRRSEPDMELLPSIQTADESLVECGTAATGIVHQARDAFLTVLDAHTVADLTTAPHKYIPSMRPPPTDTERVPSDAAA
jgi:Rrf2 family transcriptional regulator, nitric oxide-sensitive transcriptional repressor